MCICQTISVKYTEDYFPVIFVHGVSSTAAFFKGSRDFLMLKGYKASELYATTYGEGIYTKTFEEEIHCSYIRQIRRMIIAVHEYTQKKVDVITWSMGSPISRKAILGGNCTENNRYLGKSITTLVDTFISVGGVNYGVEWCSHQRHHNVCNLINSMNCECKLLKELNSKPERYEGSNSYSLYSLTDFIIGRQCCGQICGDLKHANQSLEIPNYNHLNIMTDTIIIQYNLLNH
uniref:Lipase n=1 Tax=Syphacia muris TaxID=451379 RepID=A0A0N5AVF6_9BILA